MSVKTLDFDHEKKRLHEACRLTEEELQEIFSVLREKRFPEEWFNALPSEREFRKISLWLSFLLKIALGAESQVPGLFPLFRLLMLISLPPEEKNSHFVEKIEKSLVNIFSLNASQDEETARLILKNFISVVAAEALRITETISELLKIQQEVLQDQSMENSQSKPKKPFLH